MKANMKINKKGMEIEALGKWMIGIGVLVIVVIGIIILMGNGSNILKFIQKLFGMS